MLERTYRDEYRTQARTRGRHRFVLAGPFWQGILISFGFAGITLPWRSIYLLPRYFYHHRLRLHELAHIEQIDRDGPILFIIKITYFLLRYGYRNSPYEIEARAAEDGAQLDMFEGVTLTQDKTYGSARRHSI